MIFLHPRCPCSAASLEELNKLILKTQGRLYPTAVLPYYEDIHDWLNTSLVRHLKQNPYIHEFIDKNNSEIKRFGVKTSGHALLYNDTGKLIYSGGITGARGQAGDNIGTSGVFMSLVNNTASQIKAPVFGCMLSN